MGFKMFRVRQEWSDEFRNGVRASGMLTKQMSVQHPFGNAANGFGNAVDGSGRPGMGSGLVRDCLGGVWTASRHK